MCKSQRKQKRLVQTVKLVTNSLQTYKPHLVKKASEPPATPCTLAVAQGQGQHSFNRWL